MKLPHVTRAGAAITASIVLLTGLATSSAQGYVPVDGATGGKPNIIFIVVDDMSSNLLQYMERTSALADESVSFDTFITSNSLCCPSRATMLTGKYPHNSRVRANDWPSGGLGQFYDHNLTTSLGPYLDEHGYRTGLFGKFLNGYRATGGTYGGDPHNYPEKYVPPGWDEWFVPGDGYQQFNYRATDAIDGQSEYFTARGNNEQNYFTDVLDDRATDFLDRAGDEPYFLMLSPFAVHSGDARKDPERLEFPPAPVDRRETDSRPGSWSAALFEQGNCGGGEGSDGGCPGVAFPDPSADAYRIRPANAPDWMSGEAQVTDQVEKSLSKYHKDRVRMVQSVDRLVGSVLDAVGNDNTYIVFTTDNGFHLGEHDLVYGKSTAFDHDSRLPLLIRPPGGSSLAPVGAIAQTTDLLPTFLDIADPGDETADPAGLDGVSLLPFVRGLPPPQWRDGALIEYRSGKDQDRRRDPDAEPKATRPPSYVALRTERYLYVDYSSRGGSPPSPGEGEIYDLDNDPHQTVNLYPLYAQDAQFLADLSAAASAYVACSGASCQSVARDLPTFQAPAR